MPTTLTVPTAADEVNLAEVFPRGCVEMIPEATVKSVALRRLAESLVQSGQLDHLHLGSVVDALIEREKFGTTALGKGLAFPHMRTRAVHKSIGAIGYAPGGINCESLDGQPTRLLLMVLSPYDQPERHCEIMARVAALLSDKTLQYSLQIRRSPDALYRFLGLNAEGVNNV